MKNYVLAGVVVVATVLGVSYVGKPNVSVTTPTPVVNVSVPEQKTPVVNVQAPNVSVPAPIVNVPKQVQFGAVSGPNLTNEMNFLAGALFSSTFATTSTGAGTLTYGNIKGVTTILSTNAGALTLTMPASTTLTSFIPKAGDRVQILLVNQGTTLLTLAGGTGTLLQTASSTKTVNIGGSALLNFVRKSNSDIIVNMTPAI